MVSSSKQDELFLFLEHCCWLVYAKVAKFEQIILQQRAKIQWKKGGDQYSRVFFQKIARRRMARRIMQFNDAQGVTHTELDGVTHEFVTYYQSLLGGDRRQQHDVKTVVFDIAEDKAPGPDEYSLGFYKAAWLVVGQEVIKAVLDFFSTGRRLNQINSTLLVLIPKLFGFPEAFCRWIEECVTSPLFLVEMNRKPHGFFAGARGLRQGDPLSPYLFVLVMEVMHMGLLQLMEQDMSFTFHWKCEASRVSLEYERGVASGAKIPGGSPSDEVFGSPLDLFKIIYF
ncbi:UNVERIFIED_CONTAM: hypothetical protein Sindi_2863100 [Sesamum indicum]